MYSNVYKSLRYVGRIIIERQVARNALWKFGMLNHPEAANSCTLGLPVDWILTCIDGYRMVDQFWCFSYQARCQLTAHKVYPITILYYAYRAPPSPSDRGSCRTLYFWRQAYCLSTRLLALRWCQATRWVAACNPYFYSDSKRFHSPNSACGNPLLVTRWTTNPQLFLSLESLNATHILCVQLRVQCCTMLPGARNIFPMRILTKRCRVWVNLSARLYHLTYSRLRSSAWTNILIGPWELTPGFTRNFVPISGSTKMHDAMFHTPDGLKMVVKVFHQGRDTLLIWTVAFWEFQLKWTTRSLCVSRTKRF